MNDVLKHLRGIVARTEESVPDGDLLRRYVATRDDAAFEVILWRRGPAVLGLCRRMLRSSQDAEDAFQATFLTLVRKAGSIGKGQSLASWLHKVALRICLRARQRLTRVDNVARTISEATAPTHEHDAEALALLDEEVNRLPSRYRLPVIGCYLEGKTNEEMARELGCPPGTIFSRLARARERLHLRLAKRGVTIASSALAAILANETMAAMPMPLVASTIHLCGKALTNPAALVGIPPAIAALSQGVIHTMWLAKVKKMALAYVLAALIALGSVVAYSLATAPTEQIADAPKVEKNPPLKPKMVYLNKKLQGVEQVALSTDAKFLAAVHEENTIKIWNVAGEKEVLTLLKGHSDPIGALAFSPDGKQLVAGVARSLIVWDVKTGKVVKTVRTPNTDAIGSERVEHIATVGFSPDGRYVVGGNREGRLFAGDLNSKEKVLVFQFEATDLHMITLESVFFTQGLAFSPDRKRILVAGVNPPETQGRDQSATAALIDLTTMRTEAHLPDHEAGYTCAAWSNDGKWFALGAKDRIVRLFPADKLEPAATLREHEGALTSVAFAPDHKHVASASSTGEVFLWQIDGGKLVRRLENTRKGVHALRFGDNGDSLSAACKDGSVHVWNLK